MTIRRAGTADPVEEVSTVIERLAVLIGAGVAPHDAWGHVAARTPSAVVARAAAAAADGGRVGSAIAGALGGCEPRLAEAWRSVSTAWSIALECGSPLAASLRELASVFRSVGAARREVETAWAGPRATARLIALLPLVGVLFGILMGFDTLRTLFGSAPGLVCLVLGTGLMVLGGYWNRWLIARAQPARSAPGIGIDLMTIALSGGCSIERARSIVSLSSKRYGLEEAAEDEATIADVCALASAAGAPLSELLHSEAALLRHRARMDGQAASAVLAVRLMIPLALCFLPAFLALGIAPVVIAVMASTVTSL